MTDNRSSGILLHVSSLPAAYGIGTLGKAAYEFADFLEAAGQKYWQVLPIGPTGFGNSPYQSFSSFAGNPYFIDLELLIAEGLLQKDEVDCCDFGSDPARVDFGKLYAQRDPLLKKAYDRGAMQYKNEVMSFYEKNRFWLEDYALFMALKAHFNGESWLNWEDEIRLKKDQAVVKYTRLYEEKIQFEIFKQFLFFKQWDALKIYLQQKNIKIIGDIPIYTALDSADVWAGKDNFLLDEKGYPTFVAGVPPDYFSSTGQLWGNPLYNWAFLRENQYQWWMKRIGAAAERFDVVRFDHFRGFESFWAVPYGAANAMEGAWEAGPGIDFINAMKARFPQIEFIAEDLGILTDKVRRLLRDSGFPGMKILQFAFDSNFQNPYLPHNYPENCVAYIGTHDNDTAKGWLDAVSAETFSCAKEYLGLNQEEGYVEGLIRGIMMSQAKLCILQLQDVLSLPSESRMNTPATGAGNWEWRVEKSRLTEESAEKLRRITARYGR